MGFTDSSISPWFATTTLNAPEMRAALSGLIANATNTVAETGVIPAVNALSVTPGSGNVSIAPGHVVLQTTAGGTYVGTLPSSITVAVTAQSSSARRDLVCASIQDVEAVGGQASNALRFITVEGTPSGSPVAPATPSGFEALAEINIQSSGITLIADRRRYSRASGGLRLASSLDTRNGNYPGDARIFSTGQIDIWTGSVWITAVAPTVWQQATVAWNYAGAGGGGSGTVNWGVGSSSIVRWKRDGNNLVLRYMVVMGSTGMNLGSGHLTTLLPAGMVAGGVGGYLKCVLFTTYPATVFGLASVDAGSNVVEPGFPFVAFGTGMDLRVDNWSAANAPGVLGTGVPKIPGAASASNNGAFSIGYDSIEVV